MRNSEVQKKVGKERLKLAYIRRSGTPIIGIIFGDKISRTHLGVIFLKL